MQRRLFINGVTSLERHSVIVAVASIIGKADGAILDHHQFSNKAISIDFEMASRGLAELPGQLEGAGLRLADESLAAIKQAILENQSRLEGAPVEVAGSIQITFFHHEPDLRLEVPAVPG